MDFCISPTITLWGNKVDLFSPLKTTSRGQKRSSSLPKAGHQAAEWEILNTRQFDPKSIYFYLFIYLFIYGCVGSSFLCEGFLQSRQVGTTLHRGARASHYWPLLLRSTGSRRAGSAIVAHGPSCSAACGILPDQGSNPCPLHRQADSQPLCHQGSPSLYTFKKTWWKSWHTSNI